MTGETPPLRADDEDRNRVATALSGAFSRGQLSYAEFDERTAQAWAATHRGELLALLADLLPDPAAIFDDRSPVPRPGGDPEPVGQHRPADSGIARRKVTGETGGRSLTLAVMGSSEKRGDWLCAPHHMSIALMAGTELDLRQARFQAAETTITAVALMGGTDITVPHDVRVINDGIGVMGAFEIEEDEDVTGAMAELPADAPVIRIAGLALMGAVSVRRAHRDSTD